MKWFIASILVAISFGLQAQGIEFFHGTWEEALALSKKEDKPIFVDAFAVWCGPCKRMAADVFTNDKVGTFFNANYINVKMDMEKGEGPTFGKKYPVTAFPTLMFIAADGTSLHSQKGALSVDDFLKLGQFVVTKIDKSGDFEKEYNEGKRDPQFVLEYLRALNKSNKPSLKVANDYLRDQEDVTSPFNLKFIYEATVEADSRVFELLVEHREKITAMVGATAVEDRIRYACKRTLDKAIEFKSDMLLKEAKDKMSSQLPDEAVEFGIEADMAFHKKTNDAAAFVNACKQYSKKIAKGNAADLHNLAKEIANNFGKDEKCLKAAEKYAKTAAEKGGLYEYYFTYATILHREGKKQAALKAANKSLDLAQKTGGQPVMMVEQLIRTIQG